MPPTWVVALGASAGGLEALQEFFAALRMPTGAAFVVIQHLAPGHRSMMVELLGRHCALPVREAVAGDSLHADHVYLMPRGVLMTLERERLVFEPRPQHGVSLPIDLFFRSLARSGAARSIGVVLSGSGSDGAAGALALSEAGNYVMVQQPETARFDSMPRSTVAATTVDAVLAPVDLAARVVAVTQGRIGRVAAGTLFDAASVRPALQRLFDRLIVHSGIDFAQYKLPTVMRRIERRMQAVGAPNLQAYAEQVEASATECEMLRHELLIPVTGFFRDPESFTALRAALEGAVLQLPAGRALRIWCAGCASGEEAYTLAIVAHEACSVVGRWPTVKVFATDVDQETLNVGSAGLYPAGAAEALNSERLAAHFVLQGDRMAVRADLRQRVLFARHDLLEDAPFTKIDVVVCRNTLIYFQPDPQERVLRRLQYALNPGGLLMLGSSESLGALQPDFQVIDGGAKLYRMVRPVLTSLAVREGFARAGGMRMRASDAPAGGGEPQVARLVDAASRHLIQAYAPLGLLMTLQRRLLHAWGPTQRYLRLEQGEPQLDAIRLLPAALGAVVAHTLQVAVRERMPQSAPPLPIEIDGAPLLVRVVVRPLHLDDQLEPAALVTIEELPQAATLSESPLTPGEVERLTAVERDLAEARRSLQANIEALESANEELQATNEELMSSNEELQSTNEELQSVNEELYTVNAEYNAKLDTVSALNADLDGMSQATGIATLFVDAQRQLLRFTPEAAQLFRLRAPDVGRPIEDFRPQVDCPTLVADLAAVLDGGPLIEREVTSIDGNLHLLRVLGYGEAPGRARRAVVTLIDITRLRDVRRLQAVLDSMSSHVAVLDAQGTIRQVNRAWLEFARSNAPSSAEGGVTRLKGLSVGASYLATLAQASSEDALDVLRGLQTVLAGRAERFSVTYPCHSPDQQRWFVMQAVRLADDPPGAVVSHVDITPWFRGLAETQAVGDA